MTFSFKLDATDGDARAAQLTTPHGVIETPVFMPVGTVGSVKALGPDDLDAAGAQIILGNTYHLLLRPGPERLERLGGLHEFMSWPRAVLTDSGGFQVFSLAKGERGEPLVTIDDDGVTFKSHLDGSSHRMTPEESMRVQMCFGADIIMAFDQCPPGDAPREVVQLAMKRTTAWLDRCVSSMNREESRLFGIIQGAIHADLRREHAQAITSRDLFGYAIGGLSVGEAKDEMLAALEVTTAEMPKDKPRYLMGVGTPDDLLDGILRGVDMFDCVMPTRNARTGTLYSHEGRINIKNAVHVEDQGSLDDQCPCYTCQTFTRAYLRHLYMTGELLFLRLASLHNVTYYISLVRDARRAIQAGEYAAFYRERKAAHARGK